MKSRTCQGLFLFAGLVFLLGNSGPVWADQTTATDASLAKLENRFFEHPYNQDTESDRLTRLEGFVFGSAQTGSIEDRLSHILAAVPAEPDAAPTTSSASMPAASQSSSSGSNSPSTSPGSADSAAGSLPDGSTYPRVTNLEQELLGRTYADETLPNRLARLETKAFGSPSASTDLCQRVDQLDQYAQRHDLFGERRTAIAPASGQPNMTTPWVPGATVGQARFAGSLSERLSMMEAQEFGRTYPDRSLEKRVKKLNEKVFPQDKNHLADKPLPDQVNSLWLALHPNSPIVGTPVAGGSPDLAQPSDVYSTNSDSSQYQGAGSGSNDGGSSTTGNGQPHHGWLHALAKTAGTVGKVAVGSMSGYGGYPGYGYGGGGFGGYGGGYGGYPGYGGYGSGGYSGYGNGNYFGTPSYYGNTLPNSY